MPRAFGNEVALTDDLAFGNMVARTDALHHWATCTSAFPSPHSKQTMSWFVLGAPISRKQT